MTVTKNIFFFLFWVGSFSVSLANPDTTHVPAKWKNESVVILDYTCSYKYSVSYYSPPTKETKVHISYYVRDKWGVNELSRVVLPTDINGTINQNNIGTVYKPDGSTIAISKDMLIPEKEKINFNNINRRRQISIESEIAQKLAVPSLEVGDILEIDYSSSNIYLPEYIVLVNKFPMLHFEVSVLLDYPSGTSSMSIEPIYLNTNSRADSNKKSMFGSANSYMPGSEHKENKNFFDISIDSVDKFKDEILNDNVKVIPYVLFRYGSENPYTSKTYYGESSFQDGNTEVLKNLQIFLARQIYSKPSGEEKRMANTMLASLAKKYPVIKDTAEFVKDAYYLYREIQAKESIYTGMTEGMYREDKFFTCVLSRVFFARKVRHKIFLSQPDHYALPGTYKEFISPTFGILIPGKDMYLFNPLNYYDPGNIPVYYEGQSYYSFSANKYYKRYHYFWYFWLDPLFGVATLPITLPIYIVQSVTAEHHRTLDLAKDTFPVKEAAVNQIVNEMSVTAFDTLDNSVTCEQKCFYFGKQKISEVSRALSQCIKPLQDNNPYKKMAAASLTPVKPKVISDLKKRMNDLARFELRNDGFTVKKNNEYNIVEANIFEPLKPFTYSISFTAKNLVWAFDNYIILNAGSLIGKQLEVHEESKDRQKDFYIPYKKQYVDKISIAVPAGYVALNLSEFNVKRESGAGSFIAEAKLENNTITITTTKIYSFHSYSYEHASDVYDFLKEAEKYHDKKMIFKRAA